MMCNETPEVCPIDAFTCPRMEIVWKLKPRDLDYDETVSVFKAHHVLEVGYSLPPIL